MNKVEFLGALTNEVRILLHLITKIGPAQLEYRPTPKQRNTLELLRYLSYFGPIHTRATLAPRFDRQEWGKMWTEGEAASAKLDLDGVTAAIRALPATFEELLAPFSDDDLRQPIELFGTTAARGVMLINLVLCHYAAYRMQLFLYLKAAGREELNTLNLWAGTDNWPPA